MSFIFGDLVIQTILEAGLADMRANPDARLDVLFAQLKENYFNADYGQAELNRYKTYIADNKIDIVHSHRMVAERLPCLYIQNVSSSEDEQKSFINDYSGNVDTLGGGGDVITERLEEKTVCTRDAVQVGIHIDDPGGMTALRWTYAAVIYFLISQKETMLERGLQLTTWSASDFNRLNELLPENVYSRYITFNFNTYISWTKHDAEIIIDEFDLHGGPGASYGDQHTPVDEKESAGDPTDRGKGGIKTRSGADPEYEDNSFYTVGEDT